jgi:hypothetical protein
MVAGQIGMPALNSSSTYASRGMGDDAALRRAGFQDSLDMDDRLVTGNTLQQYQMYE